jgi:5-formyltetrahydrofolate cyclo-ligase
VTTQKSEATNSKINLRKLARLNLDRLSEAEHQQNSALLTQKLTNYLNRHFSNSQRIAIFAALPHEPDLSLLHALFPQKQFLYPLVTSDTEMDFHLVTNPASLKTGAFGILEPNPQVHPPVLVDDIDLVLVPGLAFDLHGNRLGQGRGFYDLFLRQIPTTPTIGITYGSQLVPRIPTEPHDRRMSFLATNRGVIPV